MRTLHVVLPTLRPVGGVVKVFDYITHARSADWAVRCFAPDLAGPELPVFQIDRFAHLLDDPDCRFTTDATTLRVRGDDLAFLSLPSQYPLVQAALGSHHSPERIVHIIQNVRHATTTWQDGYATRLLTRPMARIMTNDVVDAAVRSWLHPSSLVRTIPLGHPSGYFEHPNRMPIGTPVRVAYTTWKSGVGDAVADRLAQEGFEFRAVREYVGWDELRDLYQWADVFLGTPNPEEGFYMPAFEAMEAGALVVVPDAGGNMAFCEFNVNCLGVPHGDVDAYVAALHRVAAMEQDEVDRFRAAADASRRPFDLDRERVAFHGFLEEVHSRIEALERRDMDPRALAVR